jgi:hypothetical protein
MITPSNPLLDEGLLYVLSGATEKEKKNKWQ